VKFNVVLTLVELTALGIVIGIGFWVMARGDADLSRLTELTSPEDTGVLLAITMATAVAFFSMVGFEDSVNMVEEVEDPRRVFPRAMLTGLGIAVVLYMLVAVAVVSVLSLDQIAEGADSEEGVLLAVVRQGLPDFPTAQLFPFLTVFAVANTALINMLMASRLIYGMARQDVLPRSLGKVDAGRRSPWTAIAFTTALALVLIVVVSRLAESTVSSLAGTTALLLLCVFTVVNLAVLVLRRDEPHADAFRAPTAAPVVAGLACLVLATPLARDREDWVQYQIAGALLAVGVVLWSVTAVINRRSRHQRTGFRDVEHLSE
jgi:amino acid transporter